jgi:hypothetical protein
LFHSFRRIVRSNGQHSCFMYCVRISVGRPAVQTDDFRGFFLSLQVIQATIILFHVLWKSTFRYLTIRSEYIIWNLFLIKAVWFESTKNYELTARLKCEMANSSKTSIRFVNNTRYKECRRLGCGAV